MMIYARVIGAAVAAALLKAAIPPVVLQRVLHVEVHGVAAYLEVLGALYSIVMAFMIYVVWEQFNRVQSGLAHEASALEDLCRVAGLLSERDPVVRIGIAAKQYAKATAGDEPQRLAEGKVSALAEEDFGGLRRSVRATEVKTEKDAV